MVKAVDIERATLNGSVSLVGDLHGFWWRITDLQSEGGTRCRISVGRLESKGDTKIIATKAKWQNAAQIIADHINKNSTP